jgi:hypothetical protein
MPKRVVDVGHWAGIPWLDIASHGRRGSWRPAHFTRSQLDQIALTVRRAPEVMVKVSGGGRSFGAVAAQLRYIGRHGKIDIETDEGERLAGRGADKSITDDWMLGDDYSGHGAGGEDARASGPSKLVHNIVLSMPANTAPEKLLAAAKAFAREEFALKNPYAMVLHTDQDHPHVHLVVKAVGLDRRRLHITKATLRLWREQFADQLRKVGIPANATPRRIRGHKSARMPDGLYRWLMPHPPKNVAPTSMRHAAIQEPPTQTLTATANLGRAGTARTIAAWEIARSNLERAGERKLSEEVRAFIVALGSQKSENVKDRSR